MSSLIKFAGKKGLLNKNNTLITNFIRHGGAWNRDWKPGPYPHTQEEREAAAKKYGLHIGDYKPYPDDGTGWGDYPMFDPVAVESRDPYEAWSSPEYRRNYGDLMHPDFDMYIAERYDINKRELIPYWKKLCIFLTIMGTLSALAYIEETTKPPRPRMNVQFPAEGAKHYTFEPVQ